MGSALGLQGPWEIHHGQQSPVSGEEEVTDIDDVYELREERQRLQEPRDRRLHQLRDRTIL